MRRGTHRGVLSHIAALSLLFALVPVGARALPSVTTAARKAEPVVITGADIPAWSRNAATGVAAPYPSGAAGGEPSPPGATEIRSAHNGTITVPPDTRAGAPVNEIVAYRWDSLAWKEIRLQVDERYPYFLANANSTFSSYSGTDQELTYAWDVEAWKKVAGECSARYPTAGELAALDASGAINPGQGETLSSYTGPMPDPAVGLDDDDEIVFMASDAGPAAPAGKPGPFGVAAGPAGTRQEIKITDPLNPEASRYVYLFRRPSGSSFGPGAGYVSYERDANADQWLDRASFKDGEPENLGSSNTSYGPNIPGKVCVTAANPGDATPRNSSDRFPRDGVTIRTDAYERYNSGRWMVRGMRIAKPGQPGVYGPDLIDRWKGRAFQQSPDSTISQVGFEDEQVNWEANSALIGERVGPVRAIREIWGADSGTNATKTETFYRDAVVFRYRLRIHPIPPDGLYTSWDYNAGVTVRYYNELRPEGVPIDGINDDTGHVDGIPIPGRPFPAFFDAPDPSFDLATAAQRWDQVSGAGDAGSLVYIFEGKEPAGPQSASAVPYYRDDKCLDDGTGDNPVPRPWPGEASTDQRVKDGYVAAARAATGNNSLTYAQLTCDQKQGAWATHGVHFFVTGDTDNAATGLPVTEIDGQQWAFAVPTAAPTNVGDPYANVVRTPLQTAVTPQTNAAGSATAPVRAGAAKVDSTWHVGASAGQYASDGTSVGTHGVDPFTQSTRRSPSYGIEGREWARAMVVEGSNGQRFGLISNDLYIPQDLVNRRVAGILAAHDRDVGLGLKQGAITGITPENLTISVSHSHSSPYYSTPSWGVWSFQDVFDLRFFEHAAQKMAQAVILAAANMEPAQMGAAVSPFTLLKRHSFGPTVADDGTPAGYPETDIDPNLSVVRFDDLDGNPIANWVIFGLHPEMLDGNDLLTGEYVNTMERIVDRDVGGITVFSQNDTGTAEPAKDVKVHAPSERQEFSHREYAQMERAAAQLASAVEATRADVTRAPTVASQVIPMSAAFDVGIKDLRFAPPSLRTYPTVSSCRTEKTFDGNPGVPVAGFPDCEYVVGNQIRDKLPFDPGVTYDTLVAAGVPIPDNVGGPSYTGLQETLQVHLQAIRLGDIGITVCPCEQWKDQSRNIRSRINLVPGDFWDGFDYTKLTVTRGAAIRNWCVQGADTKWTCADPRNKGTSDLAPVTDYLYKRMLAQIHNDAAGWEDPEYAPYAETEPTTNAQIKGNYTHEELTDYGYPMVITVGMSNDYWGYIATYREFQRGDHYRKALTGLGPHSSDFLATRLTRMAAELNGGPQVQLTAKDAAYAGEYEHQGARAETLGQNARAYMPSYEASRPADGGTPAVLTQPGNIERFAASRMTFRGGSTFSDTPHVRVERCVANCGTPGADWKTYADGTGEVQVKVNYPQAADMPAYEAGQFEWKWDATFEAFDSDIELPDAQRVRRRQTPAGTYRFVVDGCHRSAVPGAPYPQLPDPLCGSYDPGGRVKPYHRTSNSFTVGPWTGITVPSIARSDADNTASFTVGPVFPFPTSASNTEVGPIDYPNTYSSPFRFIKGRDTDNNRKEDNDLKRYGPGEADDEVFCVHCSFRPWADSGAVASASVTIVRRLGGTVTGAATYDPADGRWHSQLVMEPGDRAYVEAGDVDDTFGEFNGLRSAEIVRAYVDAGPPAAGNEGSPVTFTAEVIPEVAGSALSYGWDFGDGTSAAGGPTVSHVFGDNGVYTVTLTVTGADPDRALSDTTIATIANVAPQLGSVPDRNVRAGSPAGFVAVADDPAGANDPLTFTWTWGDGSPDTIGSNVTHTYACGPDPFPCKRNATVTVNDGDGGVDAEGFVVTIYDSGPTVDPGGPYSGDEGSAITFAASAQPGAPGAALSYDWDFGDGTNATNAGPKPSHTYAQDGVYVVTVRVSESGAGTADAQATVTVRNVAPTARIDSGPATVDEGSPAVYTASASDPGADDTVFTFKWYVDGTLQAGVEGSTLTVVYPSGPSTHHVRVAAVDSDGDTGPLSPQFTTTVRKVSAATGSGPLVVVGYWTVASDGGIFSFGAAPFHGSTGDLKLNHPVVGMATTPRSGGYWLVATDGGMFAFGDAGFYGSMGGEKLNQPIVGMASTPTGAGYWLVAQDGGIFAFGDAGFYGSMGATRLNQPIVGIVSTPSGKGYWLVASDGGIFSFGDARFYGSTGAIHLNEPIVAIAATPNGNGYWLVARDGGIFAFGDAAFYGSMGGAKLKAPIVGLDSTPTGRGYWLVAQDGGVFAYGDAEFYGSMGGRRLKEPMVGIAATAR